LSLAPLLGIVLAAASTAQAHEKGDVIIRAGIAATHMTTDVMDNEIIHEGIEEVLGIDTFDVKTKHDTRPALNFTYMLSHKVGLDLMFSTAFKHDVRLRSNAIPELGNNVDILEFKQRPLALGVSFYPRGNQPSRVHPYLGVGATYTKASLKLQGGDIEDFLRDDGLTDAEIDELRETISNDLIHKDRWGGHTLVGVDFNLAGNWLLNTQLRYTYAASDFKYLSYAVGIGVKF